MSHYGGPHSEERDYPAQLVVPSSSSNNDLPLVKDDAEVDLNPSGARICYTQEPTLMSDSPPLSLLPYIFLG
jgi:hypothetical protein